ncbi:enoyl-CoA hydratase/isomerase family protein [Botrimarina sp.]|uniref:enoyl-CoA hydratase/isomerase family protein n=1 Tax=Botrimarina sp. TaxID=2795802 RepID=UPI0032EE80D1
MATETRDSVATIRLSRRDAGHTLNPAALFQLGEAVRRAICDPRVRAIVLTGSPGAFCRGADVGYFVRSLRRGELDRLMQFTRAGAAVFDTIAGSPKRVVAALNGSAIGGGLELALACHARLAAPAASLCLPETGLGLVPGWGGLERAAALLGDGVAKWLVYAGPVVATRDAWSIGLVDGVAAPAELLDAARRVALGEPLPPRPGPRLEADRIRREYAAPTLEGVFAAASDDLSARPRQALAAASALFDGLRADASPAALAARRERAVLAAFERPDTLRRLEALPAPRGSAQRQGDDP